MQTPLLDGKPSEADKPPQNEIKMTKKTRYRQTKTETKRYFKSTHWGAEQKLNLGAEEGREIKLMTQV